MSDTPLTDLSPFFRRYDLRSRLVNAVMLCASLMLSAAVAARLLTVEERGVNPPTFMWTMGVVFSPLVIAAWWTLGELIALGRRKHTLPDGRYPAGADDARNGMRIANAGFAYNLAVTGVLVASQAMTARVVFGHPPTGDLFPRAMCVAVGAAAIYLGNLWPRMPTPRAPERGAATRMKVNRFVGWFMVIVGVLVVLFGLCLPLLYPILRR